MEAASDPELKAKCMFMMARCSQKQLHQPQYGEHRNYDEYERKTKDYYLDFMNNKYYSSLKSLYGNTDFYKDAVTRCSYLRDFVQK